jgi:hypothetical protein
MRLPGLVELPSGVMDGDEVIVAGIQQNGDGAPEAAKPMRDAAAPAAAASAQAPAAGSAP